MRDIWNMCQIAFAAFGGWVGHFIGGMDGVLITLLVIMIVDYVTGVMCGVVEKNLSSEVGWKGIFRKVIIVLLVGIANMIDMTVIKSGAVLRTAVIFFYILNEGISIMENAGRLGLPIPKKLRDVLAQLHTKEGKNEKETDK